MNARALRRPAIALLLLVLLAGLTHYFGVLEHLTLGAVQAASVRLGSLAPLVYLLLCVTGIGLGIPGGFFMVAGVAVWGAALGGPLALLGAALGCVASVWWLQRVGGTVFAESEHPRVKWILEHLDRRPVLGVAALRLLMTTSSVGNAALAFAGVRARQNLLGSLLGLVPSVLVMTLATDLMLEWLAH